MPSSEPNRGDLLPGGSEMARRMRGLDWSATDLGPPETWPDNLRAALSRCLTSRFPILIWWGPSLSVLYNDAYIPLLGPAKHPRVLGRAGRECWAEIWNEIGPMLDRVLATGTATRQENYLFYVDRRLAQEEIYVTFTCSPILASDGQGVEGVVCPCYETTAQVVGARRLETLSRLELWTGEPRSVAAVCDETIAVLRENPRDVSFAAIYVVDRQATHAHLHGTAPGHSSIFPARIRLDRNRTSGWPFNAVLRERKSRLVSLQTLGLDLGGTEWPEPIRRAVILPIPAATRDRPAGLLVLGVGQRRVLDPGYRTFLELVAGQVGTALDQAEACESERRRAEVLGPPDDLMASPASELVAPPEPGGQQDRPRREVLIQEAELRSELADVFESLTGGFMALDEEWSIRYVSAAAEPTNATARESLLGRNFWEAFPAVVGTEIEQKLRRAMAERVRVSGESYCEPPGRWYEMDIHPTQARHLAFFGRDITDRKRAEEAQGRLQRERDEALARLRLKFERMPIACIRLDAQYRITDWNPAAEAMFGYRREEVLEKEGPEILVTRRVRRETDGILRRLAAGDMDAHTVNENITKDGRTIICEWHNTPLQDADGNVIAVISMAQDITQRVEADAALRESEERYRSLISQVRDYAVFSTNGLGVVATWNEGCQQVLGYDEAEFIGLDAAKLFSLEDRAAGLPVDQLREARESGAVRNERWMQARDGRRFYGMGVTTALTRATGEPIGFSMILRDVTPMKLLQDELGRREEELSQLVTQRTDELQRTTDRLRLSERMAALGTLSAGLGHDLGNLLLPIEIRLRLLLDADLTPELRELVSGVEKGTQYLQRLASGLRSLALDPDASLEAGTTELRAWLDDVGIILRNLFGRYISLEYETPLAECWVGIKSVGLTQVVFNLVQNATDALRGLEAGRVRLGILDDPEVGAVLLSVSDNGPGMSPEVIRRCMEPYFSTKPRGVSTGMGLTFVHRLVAGAGCQMDIDSTIGQGTTVTLTLPRAAR